MSFHAIESSDCVPCKVCVGCHQQHAQPAAEGTGQPTNQTATVSPSGGPEPLEGT